MSDTNALTGTCLSMCPKKEMQWREKNRLLHVFEILSGTELNPKVDASKAVKQFSRSAAGKSQQSLADLRPSGILLETMNYLTNKIVSLNSVPWIEVYNFVNDRIQAVRQDITIQMIEDKNTVEIYEKCVRFYIISSYILCEEPQSIFDQHLNRQQLFICLKKVIYLYQKHQSDTMKEFISVYFSLNMNDCENFYRSEILFKTFFSDSLVKLTLRTCMSWIQGNYIRFFLCIQKLPIILQICFFHNFGLIRIKAIKTLSIAFSSTSCSIPLARLSSWLYLNDADTITLCQNYNIKIVTHNICFNKKDFNNQSPIPNLRKEYFIDSYLKASEIPVLINGFHPKH